MTSEMLGWKITTGNALSYAEFHATTPDGLLDYRRLAEIKLPVELDAYRHLGLVLSGRGPVWLYAYLVHLAHAFAWLALYDPRENGAIVVARHKSEAPQVGELVRIANLTDAH